MPRHLQFYLLPVAVLCAMCSASTQTVRVGNPTDVGLRIQITSLDGSALYQPSYREGACTNRDKGECILKPSAGIRISNNSSVQLVQASGEAFWTAHLRGDQFTAGKAFGLRLRASFESNVGEFFVDSELSPIAGSCEP